MDPSHWSTGPVRSGPIRSGPVIAYMESKYRRKLPAVPRDEERRNIALTIDLWSSLSPPPRPLLPTLTFISSFSLRRVKRRPALSIPLPIHPHPVSNEKTMFRRNVREVRVERREREKKKISIVLLLASIVILMLLPAWLFFFLLFLSFFISFTSRSY